MAAVQATLSYCGDQVRRFDPERSLVILCAPPEVREPLFALHAFNYLDAGGAKGLAQLIERARTSPARGDDAAAFVVEFGKARGNVARFVRIACQVSIGRLLRGCPQGTAPPARLSTAVGEVPASGSSVDSAT